jgi:ABC-type nitrate/sulfonate/bicarbonate transport system substrate-binding protein
MDRSFRRYWLQFSALICFTALLSPAGGGTAEKAADGPVEKITIAYSSMSGNMAPLWITHERGFFRKYGVDAQLVFIESGSTTVQSLISGDVALAQMAGAGAIQSRLRGSDVVIIAGVINTLTFKFYVDKNIKEPEHLRGKSVAVTRFGSSTDFATRYALERYGLVPEKDVAILQAGNMPAIVASLESGKIQGAMLSAPFTLSAKKSGFPLMADLQMLGLEYQHTGLVTTRALIKSRPDLVRNVMKAYVEGIHYYKTQRADSLAILAKYLRTSDADVLAEVYEDVGLTLTPQKPYPTMRGIEIMLRELASRDPKSKSARPEEFVDLTFIKELDSSGYIDRLYKSPVVAKREGPRPPPAPVSLKPNPAPAEKAKAAVPTAKSAVQSPAEALRDGVREYTVEAGDTLSRLAARYYGDALKWPKIHDANKHTMKNPNYIWVGQKILIPSE